MEEMDKMKKLLLAALVLSLGSTAWADVLWNQALDPNAAAYVDQEFSDYPTYSSYQVHDIVVPATGWTIQKITTWYVDGATPGNWTTVTQGRLNVFPKTGSLPAAGNDPAAGTAYPITIINPAGGIAEISMSGLNIVLPAGQYWIGFTPMTTFGTHGQKFLGQTTSIQGNQSAIRNPGGAFGFGTAWAATSVIGATLDSAIKIEGLPVPEPSSLLLLGAMALLRRR